MATPSPCPPRRRPRSHLRSHPPQPRTCPVPPVRPRPQISRAGPPRRPFRAGAARAAPPASGPCRAPSPDQALAAQPPPRGIGGPSPQPGHGHAIARRRARPLPPARPWSAVARARPAGPAPQPGAAGPVPAGPPCRTGHGGPPWMEPVRGPGRRQAAGHVPRRCSGDPARPGHAAGGWEGLLAAAALVVVLAAAGVAALALTPHGHARRTADVPRLIPGCRGPRKRWSRRTSPPSTPTTGGRCGTWAARTLARPTARWSPAIA